MLSSQCFFHSRLLKQTNSTLKGKGGKKEGDHFNIYDCRVGRYTVQCFVTLKVLYTKTDPLYFALFCFCLFVCFTWKKHFIQFVQTDSTCNEGFVLLLIQEKKIQKSKDTRERHWNGNPFQREHEKRNMKQVDIECH